MGCPCRTHINTHLGPMLVLYFLLAVIRLFADDTSVYIIADDPVAAAEILNLDLDKVTKWVEEWLLNFTLKN